MGQYSEKRLVEPVLSSEKPKEDRQKMKNYVIEKWHAYVKANTPLKYFQQYNAFINKRGEFIVGAMIELLDENNHYTNASILDKVLNFMQSEQVRQECVNLESERIKNNTWCGRPFVQLHTEVNEWLATNGLLNKPKETLKPLVKPVVQKYHQVGTVSKDDQKTLDKLKTILSKKGSKESLSQTESSKKDENPFAKITRPKTGFGNKEKGFIQKLRKQITGKDKTKVPSTRKSGESYLDGYPKGVKDCDSDASTITSSSSSSSLSTSTNDGQNDGNIRQSRHRDHPLSPKDRKLLFKNLRKEAEDTTVLFEGQGRDKETMETYQKFVLENRLSHGKPPEYPPDARIRRIRLEGSYPNWTMKEDQLPRLLR